MMIPAIHRERGIALIQVLLVTGIIALLIVTVAMLASIAGFFFIYLRRRIRMFEESNGGSY